MNNERVTVAPTLHDIFAEIVKRAGTERLAANERLNLIKHIASEREISMEEAREYIDVRRAEIKNGLF